MTDTTTDTPEIIDGTADQRDEAQRRATECSAELGEVLERHRCIIHPYQAEPEYITSPGGAPSRKVIQAATYAILPLP